MSSSLATLQVLGRLRPLSPASALSLTRRLWGASVVNARLSLDAITSSVWERRRLLDQLQAPAGPGDLLALTASECLELLGTRTVGRLAYLARAGTPDITPVNYLLEAGTVLIRSGPGPKLQAAERGDLVAFEVDQIDEVTHTGWNVVVVGRAELLPPSEAAALPLPLPWATGPRRHTVRIRPARITGRRLL